MTSKLKDKLIKVERTVNIYKINGNELLQEVSVDIIPFETLKNIVPPKGDDPLLYDGYELNKSQLSKINKFIEGKIKPDLAQFSYVLVCGGIYDW